MRKYAQPPIAKLDQMEGVAHMQGLVKRIKIMTGWSIPELVEDRAILYAEMYRHFCESWPSYNAEEIAYAVRAFGSEVKNWGKDINLSLIDECLSIYQNERKEVSNLEERKMPSTAPQLPPPSDWREMLEYYYQKFLNGGRIRSELMPADMYEQLVKDRWVEPKIWEWFKDRAVKWLFNDLTAKEAALIQNRNQYTKIELDIKFDTLMEQQEQYGEVPSIAKKLAILFCFEKMKQAGFKNIYIQESIKNESL